MGTSSSEALLFSSSLTGSFLDLLDDNEDFPFPLPLPLYFGFSSSENESSNDNFLFPDFFLRLFSSESSVPSVSYCSSFFLPFLVFFEGVFLIGVLFGDLLVPFFLQKSNSSIHSSPVTNHTLK